MAVSHVTGFRFSHRPAQSPSSGTSAVEGRSGTPSEVGRSDRYAAHPDQPVRKLSVPVLIPYGYAPSSANPAR
jgi:hypothetical protein